MGAQACASIGGRTPPGGFQVMPGSEAGASSTSICFRPTTACTTRDATCRARVSKSFGLTSEMKFDAKKSARATALSCAGKLLASSNTRG
jgi:hypothetical protein